MHKDVQWMWHDHGASRHVLSDARLMFIVVFFFIVLAIWMTTVIVVDKVVDC